MNDPYACYPDQKLEMEIISGSDNRMQTSVPQQPVKDLPRHHMAAHVWLSKFECCQNSYAAEV